MKRKFRSLLLVLALLVGVLPVTALADNAPIVVVAGEKLTPGQYIDNEGSVGSYEDRPASGYAAYLDVEDDGTANLELNGFQYEGDGQLLDVYDETNCPDGSIAAAWLENDYDDGIFAAIYSPCALNIAVIGDCSLDLNNVKDEYYDEIFEFDEVTLVFCFHAGCGIVSDDAVSIVGTKGSSLVFDEIHTGVLAGDISIRDLDLTCGDLAGSLLLIGSFGPAPHNMELQDSTVTVDNSFGWCAINSFTECLDSQDLLTVKRCTMDIDHANQDALHCYNNSSDGLPETIVIEDSELTLTNCGADAMDAGKNIFITDSTLMVDGTINEGLQAGDEDIVITRSDLTFKNINSTAIYTRGGNVTIDSSAVTIENAGKGYDFDGRPMNEAGIEADGNLDILSSAVTIDNTGWHGLYADDDSIHITDSTVNISNTKTHGICCENTYEQTGSVVRVKNAGETALMLYDNSLNSDEEYIKLNGSYLLLQGAACVMNLAPILSEAMQNNRASVNLDGSDSAAFDPELLFTYRFAEFGVEPDVEPGGRPDVDPDLPLLPILPILPILGVGSPFPDVQYGDWFYEYVCTLHNDGVLDGYPDGTFKPQNNVTNAEAVKMVLEAVGYGYQEPTNDHWASGYLAAAKRDGLIGSVNPDAPISRLEMAHLVARALDCPRSTDLSIFADCQDGYVSALYERYVLEGSYDETGARVFKPYDNLTRAEFAAILYRI